MRIIDDTFIIGIDSGYGNIKTANCCFPASVSAYDTEPVFRDNMLVYGKRFYLIGEGHVYRRLHPALCCKQRG